MKIKKNLDRLNNDLDFDENSGIILWLHNYQFQQPHRVQMMA